MEQLILVFALSVDLFVFCIAYGSSRVRLSHGVIFVFSGMGSFCLGLSLAVGAFFAGLFPPSLPQVLGSLFLGGLGVAKLWDYRCRKKQGEVVKTPGLSFQKAFLLSLAMSADSLVAGFGAGFWKKQLLLLLFISFLAGLTAAYLGYAIGRRLAEKSKRDLSWLSGLLLLLLAIQKFFQ